MNDEIAALLGEVPKQEPKPKVSKIPIKSLEPISNIDESNRINIIKNSIKNWIIKNGRSIRTSIIKNSACDGEISLTHNKSDIKINVEKVNGVVKSLEFQCTCGKKEQFSVE